MKSLLFENITAIKPKLAWALNAYHHRFREIAGNDQLYTKT